MTARLWALSPRRQSIWTPAIFQVGMWDSRGSGRVVAAAAPRAAAADAPRPLAGAAQRAVLLDGEDEVFAATRREAADRRQQRPQADLVEAHAGDEEGGGEAPQGGEGAGDHGAASRASF